MSEKDAGGRPTLIEIHEDGSFGKPVDNFLKALKIGMTTTKACELSGINTDTIYQYLNRASNDLKEGHLESKYVKFAEAYKKAKAECQAAHLQNILKAAQAGSWQASAWILERVFAKDFALKNGSEVIDDDDKIEVVNDVPKQ